MTYTTRDRMATLAVLVGLAAMLGSAAFSSSEAKFQWPDASLYNRVIVNATQGIETRPKEWLSKDKLVLDYSITNVEAIGADEAAREYESTLRRLEGYGLTVGTYISGTTVVPESQENHYPWSIVPMEWMPPSAIYHGAWSNGSPRKIIDVSDPQTRAALHSGIKRLWIKYPASVRFVDNAAVHRSTGRAQPWSSYCANITEIRKLGEAMGSRQIFNIAVHIGEMSDEETRQLIEAVGDGGILLEMPWHDNIRNNAAATERAKSRYRELLDSGMGIILAPPGVEPPQDLVDWVSSWRKPTDHLYFGGAFYKAPDAKLFGLHNVR